jgi:hypothetical protein
MCVDVADAGHPISDERPSLVASERMPVLVGNEEGVSAARGVVIAAMLSLPIWLIVGAATYIIL